MRRTRFLGRLVLVVACSLPALTVGCGPEPNPNRSPTPEQDPARFSDAVRVSEEARLKSQELERTMLKNKNMKMPAP